MNNFIITVDTEGDNQWDWKPGKSIETRNVQYLMRFQSLCEAYSFIPVYLSTYEMIMDDSFCDFVSDKVAEGKCELGMHIHSWNSPPEYDLPNRFGGCPFITEFSDEIIHEKLKYLKDLIFKRTGIIPLSFRSGRWATNKTLFEILNELGIVIDCSITPGISHLNNFGLSVEHGNDYTKEKNRVRRLCGNLIEVPMTTKRIRTVEGVTVKNRIRNVMLGKNIWLRPAVNTVEEMKMLISEVRKDKCDYLEFMIHSSELMPGGSPYTKNISDVENLYERMIDIFEYVSKDYRGISLRDYYDVVKPHI